MQSVSCHGSSVVLTTGLKPWRLLGSISLLLTLFCLEAPDMYMYFQRQAFLGQYFDTAHT